MQKSTNKANEIIKNRQESAAITIQKHFKGYSIRKYIKHRRDIDHTKSKLNLRLQQMEKAVNNKFDKYLERNQQVVTKIQSMYRSKEAKSRVKNLREIQEGVTKLAKVLKNRNEKLIKLPFKVYKVYK